MTELKWRELVEQCKQGDKKAFEALYNETKRSVYFTALKMLANEENAKDVMQDTFITAIEKLDTLEDGANFPKWVNSIAVNKCRRYFRKPAKDSLDEQLEQGFEIKDDESLIPDEYAASEEKRKVIMDIITDSVSDIQRQTIIIYSGSQYSDDHMISVCWDDLVTKDADQTDIVLPVKLEVYDADPGTYSCTLDLTNCLANSDYNVNRFDVELLEISVTVKPEATDPTEPPEETAPAFPYGIAVPVSKYVYPGDEVDLRLVIQNYNGEPLAEFISEYFCDMGLRPQNVTVTNTPETENTAEEKQSYVDIHFTVSDAADPGIYQMGLCVTAMKTVSGMEVSGQIFRNNETAPSSYRQKTLSRLHRRRSTMSCSRRAVSSRADLPN